MITEMTGTIDCNAACRDKPLLIVADYTWRDLPVRFGRIQQPGRSTNRGSNHRIYAADTEQELRDYAAAQSIEVR